MISAMFAIACRPGVRHRLVLKADGEALVFYENSERIGTVPMAPLSRVFLRGDVTLSSSLLGKLGERGIALSHVLVSAPFESSYQFFYPTPYAKVIEIGDKELADTATAQVTLAEIPFVSLRHGLPKRLGRDTVSCR